MGKSNATTPFGNSSGGHCTLHRTNRRSRVIHKPGEHNHGTALAKYQPDLGRFRQAILTSDIRPTASKTHLPIQSWTLLKTSLPKTNSLSLGEGKLFAGFLKFRARDLPNGHPQNQRRTIAVPSPGEKVG